MLNLTWKIYKYNLLIINWIGQVVKTDQTKKIASSVFVVRYEQKVFLTGLLNNMKLYNKHKTDKRSKNKHFSILHKNEVYLIL